jgi:hypothetical protein
MLLVSITVRLLQYVTSDNALPASVVDVRKHLRGKALPTRTKGVRYADVTARKVKVPRTPKVSEKQKTEYLADCARHGRTPDPKKMGVGVINSGFLMTQEWSGASFGVPMPCDGDQTLMTSLASSVAIAGELAAQAEPGIFALQPQDEIIIEAMETIGNPTGYFMVVMWNGCSQQGPNGITVPTGLDIYEVDYYCNYEVVPDSNTYSIAQTPLSPAVLGNPAPAIAAVSAAQISGAGLPADPPSTWSKIKSGFSSALKTGVKVAGYVGKAASVIEDVGEVLAAFA